MTNLTNNLTELHNLLDRHKSKGWVPEYNTYDSETRTIIWCRLFHDPLICPEMMINDTELDFGKILLNAASNGHFPIIRAIIPAILPADYANNKVISNLCYNVKKCPISELQYLLENGADANIGGLCFDLIYKNFDVDDYFAKIRLLIDYGCIPKQDEGLMFQYLIALVKLEDMDRCLKQFLEWGLDINHDNCQPLVYACWERWEVVPILIKNGANPDLIPATDLLAILFDRKNGIDVIQKMIDVGFNFQKINDMIIDPKIIEFTDFLISQEVNPITCLMLLLKQVKYKNMYHY